MNSRGRNNWIDGLRGGTSRWRTIHNQVRINKQGMMVEGFMRKSRANIAAMEYLERGLIKKLESLSITHILGNSKPSTRFLLGTGKGFFRVKVEDRFVKLVLEVG